MSNDVYQTFDRLGQLLKVSANAQTTFRASLFVSIIRLPLDSSKRSLNFHSMLKDMQVELSHS